MRHLHGPTEIENTVTQVPGVLSVVVAWIEFGLDGCGDCEIVILAVATPVISHRVVNRFESSAVSREINNTLFNRRGSKPIQIYRMTNQVPLLLSLLFEKL